MPKSTKRYTANGSQVFDNVTREMLGLPMAETAAGVVAMAMNEAEQRSAAPELLEVLEELLGEHPVLRSHPIGAENSPARRQQARQIAAEDKARAAIAKARGEGQ